MYGRRTKNGEMVHGDEYWRLLGEFMASVNRLPINEGFKLSLRQTVFNLTKAAMDDTMMFCSDTIEAEAAAAANKEADAAGGAGEGDGGEQ